MQYNEEQQIKNPGEYTLYLKVKPEDNEPVHEVLRIMEVKYVHTNASPTLNGDRRHFCEFGIHRLPYDRAVYILYNVGCRLNNSNSDKHLKANIRKAGE